MLVSWEVRVCTAASVGADISRQDHIPCEFIGDLEERATAYVYADTD
jgi:hypothetical protein